jgi:hypothetical protein
MGGGLMQLVAYGAQDVYLTGNPQITFWKVTYRRHTNFAMESIEQTFNGQADFGRRVQCTISRNGDLAYRTYLQVTLPEINQSDRNDSTEDVFARWLDCPGEQMISMVEVEIGGQRIDRQYGDWMHIWNQLTLTSEQEAGYHKMIGQTSQLTYLTDPAFADVATACGAANVPEAVCAPRQALPETTLYVPLQIWFCRNPGLALPLIALQYHEVKINIEVRPLDECLFAVSSVGNTSTGSKKVTNAYAKSLVAASLYVDYVFLDTDERRRMAQNPHEYLIEQLQFTGDESIGSSSNKVKLNFNHPCKEIIWVVQPDMHVAYCDSFLESRLMHRALGAQPFNYTDAVDALPDSILAYGSNAQTRNTTAGGVTTQAVIDGSGLFADTESFNIEDGSVISTLTYTAVHGGVAAVGATVTQTISSVDAVGILLETIVATGKVIRIFQTAAQKGVASFVTGTKLDFSGTATSTTNTTISSITTVTSGDGTMSGLSGAIDGGVSNGLTDAGVFVLAETALNMHCWGENPVVTAKLQLNGQDRFSEREGTYFDLVQPYQHHTRNPDTGINVYSFALRPEEHQPSGTCNFSRIDNATLQLVVSAAAIGGTQTAKVRVYATNYNVLRVMSGMGGLAYSN